MAFKFIISKLIQEGAICAEKNTIALDLGSANGVDSLYLAEQGLTVHAVDMEKESLDEITKKNKSIITHCCKIEDFKIKRNSYNLIIASFSLQFLSKDNAKNTIQSMVDGCIPGGVIIFNIIGNRDAWADSPKWHVWSQEEATTFVSNLPEATIRNFNQYEGLGGTIRAGLKQWHVFEFVLVKK
jgi:2-polyprenyl-3-methyl-5-hydroxy-6-metoxy-1,4-benzoquinol methylase